MEMWTEPSMGLPRDLVLDWMGTWNCLVLPSIAPVPSSVILEIGVSVLRAMGQMPSCMRVLKQQDAGDPVPESLERKLFLLSNPHHSWMLVDGRRSRVVPEDLISHSRGIGWAKGMFWSHCFWSLVLALDCHLSSSCSALGLLLGTLVPLRAGDCV